MMGASNPHPHCQIWATEHVPDEPAAERVNLKLWRESHGRGMLAEYVALELKQQERIVCQNEAFVAVVPYWAVWPFETLVLARRTIARVAGVQRRTTAGAGRYLESIDHPLRQSLRDQLSVHHGVSSGTRRGAALPCALLSAAAAVGDSKEVHGRIRDAGHAAARHSAGRCRRASARGALDALPGEPVVMHRARATADEIGVVAKPVCAHS